MQESGRESGIRVLVADDDPVSLRFVELALRGLGCSVLAVADGDAAIAATAAEPFDLLVLDRRMPGLGGAELLRALRARGIATPALATSADLDESARAELADAGYAGAVQKPLRVEDLARAVGAYGRQPPRPAEREIEDEPATGAILEDADALAAVGGDIATLKALRALLAVDLAAMAARISRSETIAADDLHRLRAACRYCGATALEQVAMGIESTMRAGATPGPGAWAEFAAGCERTRAAIAQEASAT